MSQIHESYHGYTITESDDRGGKAGRGCNLTSSLQIRDDEGTYFRYLRYPARRVGEKFKALVKAREKIDKRINEQKKTRSG